MTFFWVGPEFSVERCSEPRNLKMRSALLSGTVICLLITSRLFDGPFFRASLCLKLVLT